MTLRALGFVGLALLLVVAPQGARGQPAPISMLSAEHRTPASLPAPWPMTSESAHPPRPTVPREPF